MAEFTVVKPMGFVLKMRLVAPDGTPFSSRFYRVNWCGKTYPPANLPPHQTDAEGSLQELLDSSQTPLVQLGELQVIEMNGPTEQVMWSIPLQIVEDPPSSVLPGTEDFPPPPGVGATEDDITEYTKTLAGHFIRVVPQLRNRLPEFYRAWDQLKLNVISLPLPPEPTANDWELAQAWAMLNGAHILVSDGFEVAWRLWNLADLPLAREPSFPLFGSDVEMLLRSLNRFARRRGPGPVLILMTMPDEVEKVKKTHDRRGPLVP